MAGIKRTKKEEKCPSWDNGTREVKWPTESHHWEGGDALTLAMKAQGYSDEQLAFLMDVNVGTIKSWKCNNNGPNCPNFKKLCKVLEVDPGYFMEPAPIEKIAKDHKVGTGKKPLKKKTNIGSVMESSEVHDIYKMYFDLFKMATVLQDLGMKYNNNDLPYFNRQLQCTAQEIYKWLQGNFGKNTLNDILKELASETIGEKWKKSKSNNIHGDKKD